MGRYPFPERGLGDLTVSWSAVVNLMLQSIPAHLMAYWPFRERLRFSLRKALLPVCILQLVESLLFGYLVQTGGDGMKLAYAFAAVYMGLYLFSVRDSRHKILFLYLFITDYTMILWGTAAFLEARFFFDPDANFTSWKSVLFTLAVMTVTAPLMLCYLNRAKEKVFSTDAPVFWRTAWLIPAFTIGIVQAYTGDLSPEEVRSFRFLFARVLLLLCTFAFYSILLDALDGIRRQAALAEQAEVQEQLLNLQRMQHEQLLQYNEKVKAARHDLRQQLNVIWNYLEQSDMDGLQDYLAAYARELPPDIRRTFTKNFALNAVCTRYAEEARRLEIDYDVELDMPEQLSINEPEVCALLGNLLENAVEACRGVRCSAPFIRVRGAWEDGHITFAVDNSCEKEPLWKDGRLLSSKREGFGTGTWTVQRTAERYGGMAKFTYQDGVFFASVFLYE